MVLLSIYFGKTTRSCTWLTYISYGIIRYNTCWLPRCDLGNTCWLQGNIVLPNVMTYKIPTPQYNFNKWTDILLVLWDFRDCIVTKNTINPGIRMTSFRETIHLQRLSTDKKITCEWSLLTGGLVSRLRYLVDKMWWIVIKVFFP